MIGDLFKLKIKYSESHLFFPRVTLFILICLGCIIIINNMIKIYKNKKALEIKLKIFDENYDKIKFYGTIITLFIYILLLEKVGFLISTIAYIFTATLLFKGNMIPKTIIISIISSLSTSFIIWYIFGYLINITLP